MSRRFELVKEFLFPARVPPRGIPTMDAGLTPNDLLDDFDVLIHDDALAPEDVVVGRDGVAYVASGAQVLRIEGGSTTVHADLGSTTLGLALEASGELLACVDGWGLVRVHADGTSDVVIDSAREGIGTLSAVTVVDGAVYVTEVAARSAVASWHEWPRDLLTKGSSGRLLRWRDGEGLTTIASGLAWPYGLATQSGRLVVSESWRHRILSLAPDGSDRRVVVDKLPAYPARLHEAEDGTVSVAFFAARNSLVELVLREDEYRREMIETIPMEDWIRPALSSSRSVREPLQIGRIMSLGEIKPWAPPRSYGLVATLNAAGDLVASRHSRPGAAHHGTTAYHRHGDVELVTSHAARAVIVAGQEGTR